MERLARRNETKLINSRKETRLKERLAERKQYLSNKLTGRNETKGTNLRGRNNTKGTIFVNGMTPKERISRWGGEAYGINLQEETVIEEQIYREETRIGE